MLKILCAMALALFSFHSFAQTSAKEVCREEFEKVNLKIYTDIPAVESARMSRRFNMTPVEARNSRYELYEVTANFYVKYEDNTAEARELAGGRMIFDTRNETCRNVSIAEFTRYTKN